MTLKIGRKECTSCGIDKSLTQFKRRARRILNVCTVCSDAKVQPEFDWLTSDQKLNKKWLTKPFS